MSQESINDILKRFDQLSTNERIEVLAQLAHRQSPQPNGKSAAKSLLDSFQERGLVGSIKGAPADWSTNPDYLTGLGMSTDAQ